MTLFNPPILSDAGISECGKYRYWLTRTWAPNEPQVAFVGLNPSTADATKDDPTIRRCMGFARDWGYGGVIMLNLFAYRATDPRELLKVDDPEGPDNDLAILEAIETAADLVIAAWGRMPHERFPERVASFLKLYGRGDELCCLKLTKNGWPWHPLYCPASCKPIPYARAAGEPGGGE